MRVPLLRVKRAPERPSPAADPSVTAFAKLERRSGQKIAYAAERVTGDLATVASRILTSPRSRIPIDYRLRRVGSRWVVYDIVIEGVSFVSSYEGHVNQTIETIERSSFGELVWKMRLKEVEAAIAWPGVPAVSRLTDCQSGDTDRRLC